jgi:hypothetical protein
VGDAPNNKPASPGSAAGRKPSGKPGAPPPKRASTSIRLRGVGGSEFELLHPRCALERAEDMAEARAMVAAGEIEIAVDEVRWLLGGCHDFIDAHRFLGEMALADDDLSLARGHFGIAYQLGIKAAGGVKGTLPYRVEANQSFHESGKGLLWCLGRLGKRELARDVAETLLRLDPLDPLAIESMARELGVLPASHGA